VARRPRYAAPGLPQHVTQRGNNRSAVFASEADYLFCRDSLRRACERYGCRVHAYVLVGNHVHLLITPSTAGGIASVMQSVGRQYVRRFNGTYGRTGTLWEGRYKATMVESQRYLFTCYRYIELNPVRAGIVTAPKSYRRSSHPANAIGALDAVVVPHEEYLALGSDSMTRQDTYRAFFAVELPEDELAAVRAATNKGWALGEKRFRDGIASLLERRTMWLGRRSPGSQGAR
jgi:putative transposase